MGELKICRNNKWHNVTKKNTGRPNTMAKTKIFTGNPCGYHVSIVGNIFACIIFSV